MDIILNTGGSVVPLRIRPKVLFCLGDGPHGQGDSYEEEDGEGGRSAQRGR